nr:MAG TPA: RHS Repeat [Inoviridae sp.]
MTDAKGNVYTYSYDDNGNRIKTTYHDGSSVVPVKPTPDFIHK